MDPKRHMPPYGFEPDVPGYPLSEWHEKGGQVRGRVLWTSSTQPFTLLATRDLSKNHHPPKPHVNLNKCQGWSGPPRIEKQTNHPIEGQ